MKEQLHAKIQALDMNAFPAKIRGNITRNYGSYVGRDYKLWMQVAVFVLKDIITHEQLLVWELLSEVKHMMYNTCMESNILHLRENTIMDFDIPSKRLFIVSWSPISPCRIFQSQLTFAQYIECHLYFFFDLKCSQLTYTTTLTGTCSAFQDFNFCNSFQIFALAYSSGFDKRNSEAAKQLLHSFVKTVQRTYSELVKKAKLHLLLHLVDDIENLRPANGFCTER